MVTRGKEGLGRRRRRWRRLIKREKKGRLKIKEGRKEGGDDADTRVVKVLLQYFRPR